MSTEVNTDTTPSLESMHRRSRWVGFGVVLVAVIVGLVVASCGDDEGSGVSGTPLEIVEGWISSFENGDVAGYEGVMAEDTTYTCVECSYGDLDQSGPFFPVGSGTEGTNSGILGTSGGSLNATCSEGGSVVNCDIRVTSAFGFVDDDGQPTSEYEAKLVFTVSGGLITSYEHQARGGNVFDYGRIDAYEAWLRAEDPAAHGELFAFGTMLTGEAGQLERHRELVSRWLADG